MLGKSKLIAIITPTYNRLHYLKLLLESLKKQSSFNFEWWIIDDGSSDKTDEWVKGLPSEQFKIHYHFKSNGGKHRAINTIMNFVDNELTFIVDSDDKLTDDAVQTIESDWEDYNLKGIAGLCYLRGYNNKRIIGDSFNIDYELTTHSKSRFIDKISGDKAEIWKTIYLQTHPFLEFDGEKFFSEQFVYLSISGLKQIITRNKIIYITEYLEGGLSSNQRCLQYNNPLGALENAIISAQKIYGFIRRIKSFLMIIALSIFTKTSIQAQLHRADYGRLWRPFVPMGYLFFLGFAIHYKLNCPSVR